MWTEERVAYKPSTNRRASTIDRFALCCKECRVNLAQIKPPPDELLSYFDGSDRDSGFFYKNIRGINSLLAFASLKANEAMLPEGRGPPGIIMSGEVYHVIGGLMAGQEDGTRQHGFGISGRICLTADVRRSKGSGQF